MERHDGTRVRSITDCFAVISGLFTQLLNVGVATAQPSLGANDYVTIYAYHRGLSCCGLAWGTANAQPITIGFWIIHKSSPALQLLLSATARTIALT